MQATWPVRLIFLVLVIVTLYYAEYKLWSPVLCSFVLFSCDFLNLWLNILLDIFRSNFLSLWPFPNARDKFSSWHKQEAVMYSLIFMYWDARREDKRILLNTYKGKVKLSLCTAWRQVACGEGVNSVALLIPDLGCRWRGAVSFTIQPFYPPGKNPRCQMNRRLGGSRGGLDDFGEPKELVSLLRIGP
jgi:hypothetical protein